jgi:hypothetical protein
VKECQPTSIVTRRIRGQGRTDTSGRDETRRAPKITKVGGQRPRASNVSGKRAGDESCMYARAGSGCPCQLCKYRERLVYAPVDSRGEAALADLTRETSRVSASNPTVHRLPNETTPAPDAACTLASWVRYAAPCTPRGLEERSAHLATGRRPHVLCAAQVRGHTGRLSHDRDCVTMSSGGPPKVPLHAACRSCASRRALSTSNAVR